METKLCANCGKEFPMTSEYFYKRKDRLNGFSNNCKSCCSIKSKQRYKDNKEIARERHKKWYKANKDKVLERGRQYREENKDKEKERHKRYKDKNRDKINERNKKYKLEHKEKEKGYNKKYREKYKLRIKEYREEHKKELNELQKQWYDSNKEKKLEYCMAWYDKNKERVIERQKQYRRNNKDKINIQTNLRRARKCRLLSNLTLDQWVEIKNYFNNKCAYCGKEFPLEQDHFIPLSKGGEYSKSNIIPACRSCNASKNTKNFFEWYPKYRYYSKKREKLILEYMEYKSQT